MLLFISLFFIFTVIVFIAFLYLSHDSSVDYYSSQKKEANSGNLFSACPCVKPYVCDITGVCKLDIGMQCNSLVECVTSANYCDLACGVTRTGNLNQPPNIDNTCNSDDLILVNNICKRKINAECELNTDCETSVCNSENNKCDSKLPMNSECVSDNQCESPLKCITSERCSNNTIPINGECPTNTKLLARSCQLYENQELNAPCNTNFDCYKLKCTDGKCSKI